MVKENLTLHKAKVKRSHSSCLFVLSDRLPRIFARFQRPTVLPEKKKGHICVLEFGVLLR